MCQPWELHELRVVRPGCPMTVHAGKHGLLDTQAMLSSPCPAHWVFQHHANGIAAREAKRPGDKGRRVAAHEMLTILKPQPSGGYQRDIWLAPVGILTRANLLVGENHVLRAGGP